MQFLTLTSHGIILMLQLWMGVRELDLVQDYTGYAYDMVLGLYYAKARMYDADDRRFMSGDLLKGTILKV